MPKSPSSGREDLTLHSRVISLSIVRMMLASGGKARLDVFRRDHIWHGCRDVDETEADGYCENLATGGDGAPLSRTVRGQAKFIYLSEYQDGQFSSSCKY